MKNPFISICKIILPGSLFKVTILALFFILPSAHLHAQGFGVYPLPLRAGEQQVYMFRDSIPDHSRFFYYVTNKSVFGAIPGYPVNTIYTLPDSPDVYIAYGKIKYSHDFTGLTAYLILQLSDNSLVLINLLTSIAPPETFTPANTTPYSRVIDIAGDDLYQIVSAGTSYYLYDSRDTGRTWQADTLGINTSQRLFHLDLDTAQNVFVAADSGIYKQSLHGTTWSRTSFPLKHAYYVYTDHKNRIWAAATDDFGYNWLYKSVNDGLNWTLDSAGLHGLDATILQMGDDALGNVYVIGQTYGVFRGGNILYKSADGTGPFIRIDKGILAYNAQTGDSGIIHSVSGDSGSICVATNLGGFISNDGGVNWIPIQGVASNYCYGLVAANNGNLFVTNNLGCFTRAVGDTVWTKTYPDSGFAGGQRIWRDDAGDLFTGASMANPMGTSFSGPYFNVKSTDNGHTWNPDTAGLSQVSMYNWWVDEAGNEYAGGFYSPNFTKKPNSSWVIDTLGLTNAASNIGTAFGSDHNGTIYQAVYSGNIYSRPVSGSTWSIENGLNSDAVYSFAHTSNHTMIAGGTSNIHFKNGANWQNMPVNSPAPGGTSPFIIAVDDSNYVWAAFSHMGSSGLYQGDGVFYTPDMGSHWYPAGGQVDFITFRLLVPSGDSVFGITYANGVYVFKRGGAGTGIREISLSQNLYLYPNPASSECHVVFILPYPAQKADLLLYDVSGKVVQRFAADASVGQVNFSTRSLNKGVYYCRLMADGKIIGTKELVVQ